MELTVVRTANPNRCACADANDTDTSSLMSARYHYRVVVGYVAPNAISVDAKNYYDEDCHLDEGAVRRLFDDIWRQVKNSGHSDVEVDFSEMRSADSRLRRELGYLRRQLRHQGRCVRVSDHP